MTETLEDHQDASHPLISDKSSEVRKKKRKIVFMIILVFGYCMAEITVGYRQNFLSLIADSFHMLSDSFALFIALYGVILTNRSNNTWKGKLNTFGWGRSEIVTTLVNAVFLTALCITIFLDAIERMFSPEGTSQPLFVFFVGTGGLIVNIIGLIMFSQGEGHGHSHGGGGGHGHSHAPAKTKNEESIGLSTTAVDFSRQSFKLAHDETRKIHNGSTDEEPERDMNMRAVFLHILADFMGSVVVICAAFTLHFVGCDRLLHNNLEVQEEFKDWTQYCKLSSDYSWEAQDCYNIATNTTKFVSYSWFGCWSLNHTAMTITYLEPTWVCYIDPICSLTLCMALLILTIPLLREPILILLQTVPVTIDVQRITNKILAVENVASIHCFHIWELTTGSFIASLHILVDDMSAWMETLRKIETIFKNEGQFNLTVQPEKKLGIDVALNTVQNSELAILDARQIESSAHPCQTFDKNMPQKKQCCSHTDIK